MFVSFKTWVMIEHLKGQQNLHYFSFLFHLVFITKYIGWLYFRLYAYLDNLWIYSRFWKYWVSNKNEKFSKIIPFNPRWCFHLFCDFFFQRKFRAWSALKVLILKVIFFGRKSWTPIEHSLANWENFEFVCLGLNIMIYIFY